MAREPALRDDELRLLRVMMTDYSSQTAVDKWLASKGRAFVVVVGAISAVTVIFASLLEIGHVLL